MELETLDFIVDRGVFGVERLSNQPHVVDPCRVVDQFRLDGRKVGERGKIYTSDRRHSLECVSIDRL